MVQKFCPACVCRPRGYFYLVLNVAAVVLLFFGRVFLWRRNVGRECFSAGDSEGLCKKGLCCVLRLQAVADAPANSILDSSVRPQFEFTPFTMWKLDICRHRPLTLAR